MSGRGEWESAMPIRPPLEEASRPDELALDYRPIAALIC